MPSKKKKTVSKSKARQTRKTKAPVKKAKAANRRKHTRYATKNLWVTELSGDFQYVIPALDISEGGIFLCGRLKTDSKPSELVLNLGKQIMQLTAQPVYDRVAKKNFGVGYRFLNLSSAQSKTLRSFLRNLD